MPRRSPASTPMPATPRTARARATVASTRKKAAGPEAGPPEEALRRLDEIASRLAATCDTLARTLADVPRGDEFQPLADHLYEFARTAPELLASLRHVPAVVAPIEASVQALSQIAETLHFAHESFNESLLRLPRPEDYEPLSAPLAEFARVSPALRESLAEVLKVARPLAETVRGLEQTARTLADTEARLARALESARRPAEAAPAPRDGPAAPPSDVTPGVAAAAVECMDAARGAILDALARLPRESAYATLAAHLRELATVSPSLMEWLSQVPSLTTPLASSVESLTAAADMLAAGRRLLAGARE